MFGRPRDELSRAPLGVGQGQIDTRALELASGTSAVMQQHLDECRDRYLAMATAMTSGLNEVKAAIAESRTAREESSRRVYGLIQRATAGLIGLLLAIIGYLITTRGLPTIH